MLSEYPCMNTALIICFLISIKLMGKEVFGILSTECQSMPHAIKILITSNLLHPLTKARHMANFCPNERMNSNIIPFCGRELDIVNWNSIYHSLPFRSANLWFSPPRETPQISCPLLIWAQSPWSQSFQEFITSRHLLPNQPEKWSKDSLPAMNTSIQKEKQWLLTFRNASLCWSCIEMSFYPCSGE